MSSEGKGAVHSAVLGPLIAARAEAEPERLCLIFENGEFPDERVRYQEIAVRANQIAFELRRAGLRSGDKVAVMLRNHPEFLYALVANSKLGLITVPIDPRTRGEKLRYLLSFADCSALITADYVAADETAMDVIRELSLRLYGLSTVEGRAAGLVLKDWRTVNEILDGPDREDVGQHVADLGEPWLLAYTSGTTGDPKAIVFKYERMLFYQRIPGYFGYRPSDILYTGLSMTHGNALIVTMMPAVWGSVRHSVISRSFTKTRLWDVCARYGCTTWSNLGGIATSIYAEPPSEKDRTHAVRLVTSAGMSRELWEDFERRFGVRILEWYGTMEGGFAFNRPGEGPIGSFGKPPDGLIEMTVVDEGGNRVGPGELGELVARPAGQSASVEYYKNTDASQHKTRDGWLHTGDICWHDADGWLYFAFRQEEGGIRKQGEFISEGFIRRALLAHPAVADVHVYGVAARSGAPGESDIVAAIVLRPSTDFSSVGLFEFCRSRLERSHLPDYIQVVEGLPKTASEKVQTRLLAQALDPSLPTVFSRRATVP
jgi:crotonobetaine/carnitine-CoA ligase